MGDSWCRAVEKWTQAVSNEIKVEVTHAPNSLVQFRRVRILLGRRPTDALISFKEAAVEAAVGPNAAKCRGPISLNILPRYALMLSIQRRASLNRYKGLGCAQNIRDDLLRVSNILVYTRNSAVAGDVILALDLLRLFQFQGRVIWILVMQEEKAVV